MSKFSLSKKKEKVFPESIIIDGDTFSINADFRNILKIMRMFADDDILEKHKYQLACKWFFEEQVPLNFINEFIKFAILRNGKKIKCQTSHTRSNHIIPFRKYCIENNGDMITKSFTCFSASFKNFI